MMASSFRKHSRSSPSSVKGPRSSLVEGCSAAWWSSNVSRSKKVTHQGELGGLCVGDQAGLSCSGKALWYPWLCPLGFLFGQSWLWKWKQTSSFILVVELLSLSIHSSNVAVAARASQWASLTMASSCVPAVSCLSCWEALSIWWDR